MPISAFSQTDTTETIRSKGYVIRPEFYGAVLAEVGYQVNPHAQVSLGGGFEIAENTAVPELVAGLRMYATDTIDGRKLGFGQPSSYCRTKLQEP